MVIQAASRYIITDFVNGTDRIDLSAIDANSTTIGTGAFAGDGTADFQIQLTGHHTMTAALKPLTHTFDAAGVPCANWILPSPPWAGICH